jgi:hypothetical protein
MKRKVMQGYRNGAGVPVDSMGRPDINAIIGEMVDRGVWTYYYTLKIAAGAAVAAQYALFNAALGSADPYPLTTPAPVLTKVETNIPTAPFFTAPTDLILDSIGFEFVNDTRLVDIVAFIKNSYFEFKIDSKIFFEGQLDMYPNGTGVSGFSTQTSESSWTIGVANLHGRNRFGNYAKYVAPLQRYSLVVYFPETLPTMLASSAGGAGLWLKAYLNGLTDRAVQ